MKRKQPERQFQTAQVEFLTRALPPDAWFGAIPGGDGKVTLTPGYVAGTPDMLIIWNERAYLIENKAKRGVVQDNQVACGMALTIAGARVGIARSIEQTETLLRKWGIPLRASTGYREAA